MTRRIKALLALLLALAFVVSAASCGKKNEEGTSSTPNVSGENTEVSDVSEFISELISQPDGESSQPEETSKLHLIPADTFSDTADDGSAQRDPEYVSINYESMRGIWLDQFSMTSIYKGGNGQKPEENYTRMITKVCKGIADAGFNTIIVQVRPNGDSFYPSEYYAPSHFTVGKYGNEFEYDMLKIFIEIAHSYGLSFHAWVNPMRLTAGPNLNIMGDQYPLTQWYKDEAKRASNLSEYDSLYYLIPGVQENKELVWNGVTEICTNYNVDAVHIDDYFYPTMEDSFDDAHWTQVAEEYNITGNELLDRRQYRLDQVNSLVKGMYDAVKAVDETIWFGISPAGNISNNMNALFADVYSWGSTEGYCDYLVPQVYWGFEHPTNSCKFDVCTKAWMDLCTSDAVRLIIGIGIYRIKDSGQEAFKEYATNKDVTKRQLEFLETTGNNEGFVFYTYSTMFNTSGTLQGIQEERKNFMPTLKAFGGEDAYKVVALSDNNAEDTSDEASK